ncbi:MAG: 50S ribosomal protein L35 [Dehalococcoidia bacterium]|nr:50S ribosomal protein L35 [Dehalococcoidia bacterium]
MPKLKTHKGAKKRFHFTGTGKIMRVKQGKSHFRRRKPAKVKGLYDDTMPLHKADIKRIKKVLPYQ